MRTWNNQTVGSYALVDGSRVVHLVNIDIFCRRNMRMEVMHMNEYQILMVMISLLGLFVPMVGMIVKLLLVIIEKNAKNNYPDS